MREVTFVPSVPAKGPLLTAKDMEIVGGSIGIAGRASVTAGSQTVLVTEVACVMPAMEIMSPACASSSGSRSMPRKARIFEARKFSTALLSIASDFSAWLVFTEPAVMRPVTTRPRYGLLSIMVTSIEKGLFSSTFGGGTYSQIRSNRGARSFCSPPSVFDAQP